MRRLIVILTLFILVFTLTVSARERNSERGKIASILKSNVIVLEKFDVNRISNDVENTGQYVSYHRTNDAGLEWPKGSHMTADFAAGVWVAGKVRGTGELRTAAAEYQVEFEPGKILPNGQPDNADDPRYKIWKINKTDLYNPSDDYLNWPVEDGAPWEDVDGDGVFTRGVDRPLLMGDQTLWMVFNDANPAAHNIFKTAPMGLEVQMTIWGYNRVDAFGDMMFVKCVIINKSNNTYDSTFVALWDDPDLGYAGDDYVGCDTTLSLGYCYNASNTDNVYGSAPPAIGRDFFQGVRVYTGNPDDSAKAFGKWWKGYKNLPMYAFTFYWNGAPFPYRDPEFADEAYNFMRGYLADGTPYVDPNTNQTTRFVFPGDPEAGTGWLDGTRVGPTTLSPGDRRFLMSNGPFTIAPGDTQEIVFGLLIARGSSNVNSVTVLKLIDRQAQLAYDLDFQLPPTPPFPNVQVAELDREIVLYWPYDKNIDEYSEVDLIDRDPEGNPTRYNFEGFIVYQFDSPTQPTKWTRIAVFDVVNDVKDIKDWVFDPTRGENIEVTVVRGTDSGIQRTIRITKDYLNDKPLVNGRPYYFAVTAYAYNPYGVPRFYESARNIITVIPRPASPGVRYTSAVGDTVRSIHKQGVSDGEVFGLVVDPSKLTGHKYEVRFDTTGGEVTWRLVDVTLNQVKLSGQTNQSGDANYTVVDGIQFKVLGPPRTVKDFWEVANANGPHPPTYAAFRFNDSGFPTTLPGDPDRPEPNAGGARWGIHTGAAGGAIGSDFSFERFILRVFRGDNFNRFIPYDFEIRFTPQGGKAWLAFTNGKVIDVPFEVWNIGIGTPDDPSDDYQMIPWVYDVNENDKFDLDGWDHPISGGDNDPETDWIYIREPFDKSPGNSGYLNEFVNKGDAYDGTHNGRVHPEVMARLVFVNFNGGSVSDPNFPNNVNQQLPETGTIFRIISTKPNTVNDVFEITVPAPTYSVELAKSDLEKVNAFPNPYFGASPLEKDITEAFITFTRLPNKCTIRIFTVAGDLVRTIQKDDDSPYVRWDLRNEAGVPVASGIYIVHVDAPGIGSKILKVVVFQREERLRYF